MKVLIVGYGSVGKKHHNALIQIDPLVKMVAWRSSLKSDNIENVFSVYSFDDLNRNGPYDFAIISNPTNRHEETINNLLDLKCPLFIEKPLFNSLVVGTILDRIASCNVKTYVACNLRFLDSIIFLKEKLLPEIQINEVNVYCGSFLPEWRQGVDYKSVYSAHQEQGGGVHLDLIHEIDYTYWLFGSPLFVKSFKRSNSTIGIDAVDYANYLLEYDNFAVNIILNYYRKDKKRTIELVCADDTYSVDLYANSVSSTKEMIYQSGQNILDTYLKQMEYFFDIISNPLKRDENIMNNVNEAFEVLKICLHQ